VYSVNYAIFNGAGGRINLQEEYSNPILAGTCSVHQYVNQLDSQVSFKLHLHLMMKISGNFPESFRKVSGNFARESFHCGKFPKRGFCADLARLRPNLQLIST
jgi:hypothetical protein